MYIVVYSVSESVIKLVTAIQLLLVKSYIPSIMSTCGIFFLTYLTLIETLHNK